MSSSSLLGKRIRSRILTCLSRSPAELVYMADAIVSIDIQGRIAKVEDLTSSGVDSCTYDMDYRPGILMPSFIDTHIHFPQIRVLGAATLPLLQWLEKNTFPEESRYANEEHARDMASKFVTAVAASGTTLALVYCSVHPSSAAALFDAATQKGIRVIAGPVLMDSNCPSDLQLPCSEAIPALRELIHHYHQKEDGRLEVAVIPRFALSCSERMLKEAGELAKEHDLWVSTHLAESVDECSIACSMFGTEDYLEVYEKCGLVHDKSVFAHCCYLSENELTRFSSAGSIISHCPDSNVFLGSGRMSLRSVLDHGIPVTLGTDVAGGRSFSIQRMMTSAYDTAIQNKIDRRSQFRRGDHIDVDENHDKVNDTYDFGVKIPTQAELLWFATRGAALALKKEELGCVMENFDADLILAEVPSWATELDQILSWLFFDLDAPRPRYTWCRGQTVWDRDSWSGGFVWESRK